VAYAKDKAAAKPELWVGVRFENAAVVPRPTEAAAYAQKQAAKMPLPQLCHTLELVNGMPVMPDADTWVMEPKLDGNRLIGHVRPDGQVDLYGGRNGTPWTQSALDPIRDVLAKACPPDTIVDGELMVPMTHARSSDVTHAVASGQSLELWLFDVLKLAGQSITHIEWSARRLLLEKLEFADQTVKLTPVATPNWTLAQEWVKLGIEGIVCKRKSAPYQVGKRSHDVLKWKPQETLEGRIIGFVEGKNGIAGQIGALELEIEGSGVKTTVSCPPELSVQILAENGLNRFDAAIHAHNDWFGRCVEIKHYGLFPSGSPRHPGFVRLRPDRDR
jgi:ATP-dependent DNA ligase